MSSRCLYHVWEKNGSGAPDIFPTLISATKRTEDQKGQPPHLSRQAPSPPASSCRGHPSCPVIWRLGRSKGSDGGWWPISRSWNSQTRLWLRFFTRSEQQRGRFTLKLMRPHSRAPHVWRLHKQSSCGKLYKSVTSHTMNTTEGSVCFCPDIPPSPWWGEHRLFETWPKVSWARGRFSLDLGRCVCDFLVKLEKIPMEYFHLWTAWNLEEFSTDKFSG